LYLLTLFNAPKLTQTNNEQLYFYLLMLTKINKYCKKKFIARYLLVLVNTNISVN